MSIASEITRLQTAKANIKTAINTKGGSLTTETISSYATAINNLPSGDLTIDGQQIITGILTGTVDEFDTVYSKFVGDGSNWGTVHNKLSNPADLPTGSGNAISFSSNGSYLAVVHNDSPGIAVYKRSGDVFNKLTGIETLPIAINGDDEEYVSGNAISFSSDDTYLAVAHDGSPYLTVYKRSGDTFTKLTGITAPAGNCYGISLSSDATYLAVAHYASPFITVYKRSEDTFTKITGITAPTGETLASYDVAFSNDATYLAVAYRASPYLNVYKRSGDTFTKLTGITALAGQGKGVAFSNDATYLAVAYRASPYLNVYKRSGDTFTKLTVSQVPALSGYADGFSVSFSSDDTYLAVAHYASPFITVYKRSEDTFTKISGFEAPQEVNYGSYGVSFSSDDTYLAVAHDRTPFLTIYKTTLINPTTLISPALNEVPLGYHDLGYAKESGVEYDEIDMVSIFR